MTAPLIDALIVFGAVVAPFSLADQLVESKDKHKISWHLFGYEEHTDTNYRRIASNAMIVLYFKSNGYGRFNWIFAFFVSLAILTIFLLLVADFSNDKLYAEYFILILFASAATLIIDYFSLKIKRQLFFNKEFSLILEIFQVLEDFLLTCSIIIIYVVIIAAISVFILISLENLNIYKLNNSDRHFWLLLTLISSSTSPLIITIIHFSCILFGLMHKIVIKLLKLNQIISKLSRVHEFPFTFIGLYLGFICAIFLT